MRKCKHIDTDTNVWQFFLPDKKCKKQDMKQWNQRPKRNASNMVLRIEPTQKRMEHV